MEEPLPDLACLKGRRILVTGHTGFKGAWLAYWLTRLGADVTGVALAPAGDRNLFVDLRLERLMRSLVCDVRDEEAIAGVLAAHRPDAIFHLAAQSLVRRGYERPVETFETNVTGTLNVLQGARTAASAQCVIVVTSDKCYAQEPGASRPFREGDPLGGHDPYSASKACAEIATAAFRSSYEARGGMIVATARAGNVIGGGDWSDDRIVPDAVRAVMAKRVLEVRSPEAIRPWQHVLESLQGYLRLACRAIRGDRSVAQAWNFGPATGDEIAVGRVVELLQRSLPIQWKHVPASEHLHEAAVLRLDSHKARTELQWQPRYRVEEAVARTAEWYLRVLGGEDARAVTGEQVDAYGA